MSSSPDTSDSELESNAFFDAYDAVVDSDGNRQSVRYSETPLSSDVDRVLERVAVKQARLARKAIPEEMHSNEDNNSNASLLPTVNLLRHNLFTHLFHLPLPELSTSRGSNEDGESNDDTDMATVTLAPQPATLPRARTAPMNQYYAGVRNSIVNSLVTSGATLPRRSAAHRVTSRQVTRATACMDQITDKASGVSGDSPQRTVTIRALDLAAEENIVGRRRSIELLNGNGHSQLIGDDDDDDPQADSRSVLSSYSVTYGNEVIDESSYKDSSALSIDEINVDKSSNNRHASRLSCDNQTLALPSGRRSMDVQSINLAMWQAEFVDERFATTNMSSTNLSSTPDEHHREQSLLGHPVASSILIRNLDTGELVRLDQVEETSELSSPRLPPSTSNDLPTTVISSAEEEQKSTTSSNETVAPVHKRNRSLFARMRGFRSKPSSSTSDHGTSSTGSTGSSQTRSSSSTTRTLDKSASYIKIRVRHKRDVYLRRLIKMQDLDTEIVNIESSNQSSSIGNGSSRTSTSSTSTSTSNRGIWALHISRCGRYLAASGQDHINTQQTGTRTTDEHGLNRARSRRGTMGLARRNEIFCQRPMRTWIGHKNDVLELAWSKNNFLLSSSMDKTVKLWHVTRDECLYTFKHSDFVTSVAFHPKDERLFLSGSMDGKLRLWSIPEKRVKYWQEIPNGWFKVSHQILVKSKGKGGRAKKITGIQAMPGLAPGEDKMLITSNDSRIRLYNLRDMSLERRFKGLRNVNSQIRATFSDDGRFVICGSEDRSIYVWDAMDGTLTSQSVSSQSSHGSSATSTRSGEWRWLRRQPNPPYEQFHVTAAVIAPMRTKQLLSDASSRQALAAACIIVSGDYAGNIRVFVNTPPDIITGDRDNDAPHLSKSTTSNQPRNRDRRRTMMTDTTSILSEATWTDESGTNNATIESNNDSVPRPSRSDPTSRPRIITGSANSIYSVARSDISGGKGSMSLSSMARHQSFFSSYVSLPHTENDGHSVQPSELTLADSASTYSGAMSPPSVTITHAPFLEIDAMTKSSQVNS
ncbi:hypothetical protein BDF22DRAFT_739736 [Syncephalis plumigaleata]|nr:hypothetical protein BDF22DRAFT_739736 [Syncephalis plumigaleata]